jgi:signal transduction histidine kinase
MSDSNLLSAKNSPLRRIILILIIFTACLSNQKSHAQTNQFVQVKTFTESLQAYPNLQISINNGAFVKLDEKGIVFVNLKSSDIPIQSIKPKDDALEVASWNLSKGVLEVIIRKKSYVDKQIKVVGNDGIGLSGILVRYLGKKKISKRTDSNGVLSIPLGLTEEIGDVQQFVIPGYKILGFEKKSTVFITVEKVNSSLEKQEKIEQKNEISKTNKLLQQLDTITSLKVFYDLLRSIERNTLDKSSQVRLDQKFNELYRSIIETNSLDSVNLLDEISDSTIVEGDIDNLLQTIRNENQTMSENRIVIEEKIQIVRDKLNLGFENMSEDFKENLLKDIEELENVLEENKNEFNENLNTYSAVINELKRRFFDLKELEGKLSESESERLKERQLYRQRLLTILGVVLLFSLLILMLFYFRSKLKRQKMALIEANKIVKLTNENLENIVLERTHLLQKTFKELDTVLYKASHDLRAPLSSIEGITYLLNRESNSSELTGLLLKTNKRMDKLLKKLSIVSEIHQSGSFEEFDLKKLCEEVTVLFKDTIKERAIDFSITMEGKEKVLSIPNLVEVILYHLLENAFYFCSITDEKQGRVNLKINRSKENLEISVSDNGIGLDQSITHKIFEMFYVGTEHSDGNGLGLYIVQKSVDLLNGKVSVSTNKAGITKFVVKLPTNGKGSSTLEFLGGLRA